MNLSNRKKAHKICKEANYDPTENSQYISTSTVHILQSSK